ncbi:MAG: flagellar biosynthesis protein FliQ [Nitrospirota bacterium]|nr:flagellar biosynthesis protein FliQ [Nitrospirota bacterium]
MTPEMVMDVGRMAIETTLLVAGPLLGISLLVGLLIGAFQAMTQINEMTLTFVPKIITVFVTLLVGFPWFLKVYLGFITSILVNIPAYVG